MKLILSCLVFLFSSIATYHSNAELFYPETMPEQFDEDMSVVNAEYYYHARNWGDSKEFSPAREQYLIKKIEDEYFITGKYHEIAEEYNLVVFPESIGFAKMFLSYGLDPLIPTRLSKIVPLQLIVYQEYYPEPAENFANGDELIAYVMKDYPRNILSANRWGITLSPNQAIEMAKFYLALGNDVHAKRKGYRQPQINPLTASFTEYYFDIVRDNGEISKGNIAFEDIPAPDPNPLPAYYELPRPPDGGKYAYRKSKVTYWLEEFIEAGYPASMLDTHKLHYLRFMKKASVAEVMDMLNNPDAHKIPANINCPYKETCPLTPYVNMRDAMGRTPLHIAGEQGNKAVYDALIQIGADESVKDFRGNVAGL